MPDFAPRTKPKALRYGLPLARAGYRCSTIAATTYEEAPERLWAWMRQRTRWSKGYLQTWLVHMRKPWALWRELGFKGALAFQLTIGATLLSSLIHPWFYVLAAYQLFDGGLLTRPDRLMGWPLWGLALFDCAAGYLTSMALAYGTIRRRRLGRLWPQIFVMPLYWLLISAAAYRGLWQFITARFCWEKTEHGLSRPHQTRRPRR